MPNHFRGFVKSVVSAVWRKHDLFRNILFLLLKVSKRYDLINVIRTRFLIYPAGIKAGCIVQPGPEGSHSNSIPKMRPLQIAYGRKAFPVAGRPSRSAGDRE
jgi:hypothetical protein